MRFLGVVVLLAFLLVGCQQQETTDKTMGKVYPSVAFKESFGEPPVPQQGYAYAHVGYLPLKDNSGQVGPIPLFMFKENEHLDRILSQLFSEQLVVSARSKLSSPAAQGVQLTQLDQAGETLMVYLQAPVDKSFDRTGIDRAITETATQFEEVSRVQIFYNGEPSEQQPAEGYQSRSESIAAVESPMLLDVVGIWEPGATGPEEILINFDRPVVINGFRLLNKSGEQIGGKYYTSVFNMAVVVHPAEPENFTEGMVLNVSWDVDDHLGRGNSALDSMTLSRREH